jgi:hypothetical protein
MCIMGVRAGQHATTIAQSIAHNVSTCERDAEMFRQLLIARGDVEMLAHIERAQLSLQSAYESLLAAFGGELAHDVDSGHNPDSTIGSARAHVAHPPVVDAEMIRKVAEIAATRARRYETR